MMESVDLYNSNLNNQFDKVLVDVSLSKSEIFEACEVRETGPFTSLDYNSVFKILNFLNIDLEELSQGNVCATTVDEQLRGNKEYIREDLIGNKGSRLKTFSSSLSILPKINQDQLLRKFQINRLSLKDEMRLVSAKLLEKTFRELAGFSYASQLDIVGQVNCQNFMKSGIINALEDFDTAIEAYAHFLEFQTTMIEKNMDYRLISIAENKIKFEYQTKEVVKDFFNTKHFGNIGFCQNIQGFLVELSKYKFDNPPTVNKLSCAHLGQSSCTYEVVFNNIVPN